MAPVTLIVGKHRRDQTEDKEAIQIFSYNHWYIFHVVQKKLWKTDRVVVIVRNKLAIFLPCAMTVFKSSM